MENEIRNYFSEEGEKPASEDAEAAKAEREKDTELKERLTSLIRSISGNPLLEVTTDVSPQTLFEMAQEGKNAHKEWYREQQFDRKTRKAIKELVHIPREITENEEVAKGKAAHEAGHVVITRTGDVVPDKVKQELGFHSLLMAAEERPTDQVVRDRYPGAGEWVDSARKDSVREGEELLEGKELLGYMPKFEQLCTLIVYAPHHKKMPAYIDPEIAKLYQEMQRDIEAVEHTLPPEGSGEKETIAAARERYKIVYKKLWPRYKTLVEEDKKTEAQRQMLLDPELRKKILEKLKDEMKTKLLEQIESSPKKEDEEKKEQKILFPMHLLPREILEALGKAFGELSSEQKKIFIDRAREELESLEDALVSDLSGKLGKAPETHGEYRVRKGKEGEEGRKKKKREEEREETENEEKDVEKKLQELEEKKSIYDKTYAEVREFDDALYRDLEEVFRPNVKRKAKLKSAGSRISLPALYKWESQRGAGVQTIDSRIFEVEFHPEKKDYAVTVLVDLSGSMRGEKIKETFKAVVLLNEVLNRLGIQYEILGFQDELIEFKKFDQKLTEDIRNKISGMRLEVNNSNPGGHNGAGHNDDGPCLSEASARLEKQGAKEKFLLALSDGLPNGKYSTQEDLENAVQHTLTQTQQKLVGLGLGSGTEHVKRYYPTSLPEIDVKHLTEVLGNLLKDMIISPRKYEYRKP